MSVLAVPGTPSMRTLPPTRKAARSSSKVASDCTTTRRTRSSAASRNSLGVMRLMSCGGLFRVAALSYGAGQLVQPLEGGVRMAHRLAQGALAARCVYGRDSLGDGLSTRRRQSALDQLGGGQRPVEDGGAERAGDAPAVVAGEVGAQREELAAATVEAGHRLDVLVHGAAGGFGADGAQCGAEASPGEEQVEKEEQAAVHAGPAERRAEDVALNPGGERRVRGEPTARIHVQAFVKHHG